jgi:hypothetical protein
MPTKKLKNYGLIPQDYREILRKRATTHQVFGSIAPANLPTRLILPDIVGPTDQGTTSICFSYCTRQLLSDQLGIVFDENWALAKAGETNGQPVATGCQALTAMEAMVKFGPLALTLCPPGMTWEEKGVDFVANWKNWDPSLDLKAAPNEQGSVLPVDGPYDDFDNVRSFMQMHQRHVAFATKWYTEFNNPNPDGTVKDPGTLEPTSIYSMHMYEAMDFDVVGGQEVIRIKPHEGASYGVGGYAYLNRSQVNNIIEDPFAAALCFSDAPTNVLQRMQIQNLSLEEIFDELAARIKATI